MDEPHVILQVDQLSLSFPSEKGRNLVLDSITFDLRENEILGIVGESGSGKSVTSLAIMQLLSSQAQIEGGRIILCSDQSCSDILGLSEKELCQIRGKEISMIFQEPMSSLNPSHRCGHQVREAVLIHHKLSKDEAEKRVKSLFEKVELPDIDRIYKSYPHQLSGGQLQRVMIAMALINHPRIIIADEPTTALDVTVQKSILQLLRNISAEYGSAIIFISHDLGVIREICDRVVVMQSGKVKEKGEVEQIFQHPKDPYTKGLIACRPPFDVRLNRLPMVSDFLEHEDRRPADFITSLVQNKETFNTRLNVLSHHEDLLNVTHLSKSYVKSRNFFGKPTAYHDAVKDVSFTVRQGEVLGLVGESGCGKSTLGKTILRLIEPNHGSIHFDGRDVQSLAGEELRKLRKDFQIIFQDPYSSLNPRMKIGDAIKEPMQVHHLYENDKIRKDKVTHLLSLVGLEADHYNRYPHQFSGGQRQRICIARTLSMNPKFIVCDESVSALDVSVQAQVLNLLLDLKEQFGLSYLFISHNIGVVKFFCDNVMVMQNGVIVERGDVESIYHNPQNSYTQRLIEAVPKY